MLKPQSTGQRPIFIHSNPNQALKFKWQALHSSRGQFVVVSEAAPQGTNTATGGFPLQVLLILGGMMGAVAVFVLFKARK